MELCYIPSSGRFLCFLNPTRPPPRSRPLHSPRAAVAAFCECTVPLTALHTARAAAQTEFPTTRRPYTKCAARPRQARASTRACTAAPPRDPLPSSPSQQPRRYQVRLARQRAATRQATSGVMSWAKAVARRAAARMMRRQPAGVAASTSPRGTRTTRWPGVRAAAGERTSGGRGGGGRPKARRRAAAARARARVAPARRGVPGGGPHRLRCGLGSASAEWSVASAHFVGSAIFPQLASVSFPSPCCLVAFAVRLFTIFSHGSRFARMLLARVRVLVGRSTWDSLARRLRRSATVARPSHHLRTKPVKTPLHWRGGLPCDKKEGSPRI